MKKTVFALLTSLVTLVTTAVPLTALADTTPAAKIQSCTICHNAKMNSLAGKGKAHLVTQMKAIRAGKKAHPAVMSGFSDKDINAAADHLSKMP